jgi:hypothetical protein
MTRSNLSRRSIVAGAATLPALAIPAAAAITPDPALAAVERRQAAWKAHVAVCDQEPALHSPLYNEWDAKAETVCSVHSDAEWAMLRTIPTTKAGAVAMITSYLERLDVLDDNARERQLLESLAEAIPHLA